MATTATTGQQTEQDLKQEALTVIEVARAVKIVDQPSYDQATYLLMERIIPFRKKWANYWEPLKRAAHEAHKAILAKFNEGDEPAERAERIVKEEIRKWNAEQDRIQAELQRKAQEAAEKQEREERLQAAVAAEVAGAGEEEVTAILDAPVAIAAAPVAPTFNRARGVSSRDNWKCRVDDIKALARAVAAGKVPANYILPNEVVLNARARADRELLQVPGCTAVNEQIISGRTR